MPVEAEVQGTAAPLPRVPGGVDPRELVRATSSDVAPGELGPPGAIAQAAGVFDGRNNETLAWLRTVLPSDAHGESETEPAEPVQVNV